MPHFWSGKRQRGTTRIPRRTAPRPSSEPEALSDLSERSASQPQTAAVSANETTPSYGSVGERKLNAYASALLAVYQLERQDQQTSGNQSRALLGTGLAYAAGVAALLSRGDSKHLTPLLLLAAPLPLVALIAFLVLGIGNIQQRAKYLVALEKELEPHLSLADPTGTHQFRLTVPNGFRRSEYVFSPSPRPSDPPTDGGAGPVPRAIASYALGFLTHGVMFVVQIGLAAYVLHLLGGSYRVLGVALYATCLGVQLLGVYVALRPGTWEAPAETMLTDSDEAEGPTCGVASSAPAAAPPSPPGL